jgi:predicted amidohydrolase YtcJ
MSVLNQFVSPELRDSMYPIRQLIAQKVAIGFGSDWPVSSLNPLDGIEVQNLLTQASNNKITPRP